MFIVWLLVLVMALAVVSYNDYTTGGENHDSRYKEVEDYNMDWDNLYFSTKGGYDHRDVRERKSFWF